MSANTNAMIEKLRQYGGLSSQQVKDIADQFWARITLFKADGQPIKVEDIGRFSAEQDASGDFWVGKNTSHSISITVPYDAVGALVSASGLNTGITYKKPKIDKVVLDVYSKTADSGMVGDLLRFEANLIGTWTVEGTVSGVYTVQIPENVLLVPVDPF